MSEIVCVIFSTEWIDKSKKVPEVFGRNSRHSSKKQIYLKKFSKNEIENTKMVKHCCYSGCNSNTKRHDVKFIPFVKPSKNLQRCRRWVHLCGRDSETFNYTKITRARLFYLIVYRIFVSYPGSFLVKMVHDNFHSNVFSWNSNF